MDASGSRSVYSPRPLLNKLAAFLGRFHEYKSTDASMQMMSFHMDSKVSSASQWFVIGDANKSFVHMIR